MSNHTCADINLFKNAAAAAKSLQSVVHRDDGTAWGEGWEGKKCESLGDTCEEPEKMLPHGLSEGFEGAEGI